MDTRRCPILEERGFGCRRIRAAITSEHVARAASLLHADESKHSTIRQWLEDAYLVYLSAGDRRARPFAQDVRDRLHNIHKLSTLLATELERIDFLTAQWLSRRGTMVAMGKMSLLMSKGRDLRNLADDAQRALFRASSGRGGRPKHQELNGFLRSMASLYTEVTGERPKWSQAKFVCGEFFDFMEHCVSILESPPTSGALASRLQRLGRSKPTSEK